MDELEKELVELIPKTKLGKLRKYFPAIDQKLNDGATAQEILQILNSHGIELTEGTFRYYLHRYRKQKKANAASPKKSAWQPEMPEESAQFGSPTLQELVSVMQPDPDQLATEIAEKERRFKEHERNLKRREEQ